MFGFFNKLKNLKLTKFSRKTSRTKTKENGIIVRNYTIYPVGEARTWLKDFPTANIYYNQEKKIVVIEPMDSEKGTSKIMPANGGRQVVISISLGKKMPTGLYTYVAANETGLIYELKVSKKFKS